MVSTYPVSGLSYREASAALKPFVDRCWTGVWQWVQGLGRRVESLFTVRSEAAWVDETQVWAGSTVSLEGSGWRWTLRPGEYSASGSRRRGQVSQPSRFLSRLRREDPVHTIYMDGGVWYPMGCRAGEAPPPCCPGAGGEEQVRGG